MQDLIAEDFPTLGTVTTFSWLAPRARRRGIGREMRAAILHLAFAGLGAREATSEAFVDNTASNAVSRALGYEENGTAWAGRSAGGPLREECLVRTARSGKIVADANIFLEARDHARA